MSELLSSVFFPSTASFAGRLAADRLVDGVDAPGHFLEDRGGWSNGPLAAGSYSFDIYAGAGQCDLSKGTKVGTLSVVYDGSSASVTYTTDSGFSMEEVHLYVGAEPLPSSDGEHTVAPGQYPIVADDLQPGTTSYTTTVSNLSGPIYIVAHSVVCGSYR